MPQERYLKNYTQGDSPTPGAYLDNKTLDSELMLYWNKTFGDLRRACLAYGTDMNYSGPRADCGGPLSKSWLLVFILCVIPFLEWAGHTTPSCPLVPAPMKLP